MIKICRAGILIPAGICEIKDGQDVTCPILRVAIFVVQSVRPLATG
jgi:hypothetical protein